MKKFVTLFFVIFLVSCEKSFVTPQDYIELKPIMIQVDAVHTDGYVIQSPITVVR